MSYTTEQIDWQHGTRRRQNDIAIELQGIRSYSVAPTVIHAFVFKLYHLLHVMLFCSIFAAFYGILRKPDYFLITEPIQINQEQQTTRVYQVWK